MSQVQSPLEVNSFIEIILLFPASKQYKNANIANFAYFGKLKCVHKCETGWITMESEIIVSQLNNAYKSKSNISFLWESLIILLIMNSSSFFDIYWHAIVQYTVNLRQCVGMHCFRVKLMHTQFNSLSQLLNLKIHVRTLCLWKCLFHNTYNC